MNRSFGACIVLAGTLLLRPPVGLDTLSAQTQTNSTKTSRAASTSSTKRKTASSKSKRRYSKNQVARKRAPRGQREIEPSRVIEIQAALAGVGFYKEEPSGKWDTSTTQAMSAYQESNGFKVTGKPDALSLKKLGL
jgi:peptidoglycan hydrolase-like protein with peptidoglycan-binding domain